MCASARISVVHKRARIVVRRGKGSVVCRLVFAVRRASTGHMQVGSCGRENSVLRQVDAERHRDRGDCSCGLRRCVSVTTQGCHDSTPYVIDNIYLQCNQCSSFAYSCWSLICNQGTGTNLKVAGKTVLSCLPLFGALQIQSFW